MGATICESIASWRRRGRTWRGTGRGFHDDFPDAAIVHSRTPVAGLFFALPGPAWRRLRKGVLRPGVGDVSGAPADGSGSLIRPLTQRVHGRRQGHNSVRSVQPARIATPLVFHPADAERVYEFPRCRQRRDTDPIHRTGSRQHCPIAGLTAISLSTSSIAAPRECSLRPPEAFAWFRCTA